MNENSQTRRNKLHSRLVKLCVTALMTAIVFWGNTARIIIPISIGGNTAFTLGNIFGVLSGILLGPWWGFLAAGLGPALYDMTNPVYAAEAPLTFLI